MTQIPSFGELVNQKVAEQTAAQQATAAAARKSALRRIRQEAELERQTREQAARAAAQLALVNEMQAALRNDASQAASMLLGHEVQQDVWQGSVEKKLSHFRLFGKSDYVHVDNRKMVGWLVAARIKPVTRIVRTIYHPGYSYSGYGESISEGPWTENITKAVYFANPVVLSTSGELVVPSKPIWVTSQNADNSEVLKSLRLGALPEPDPNEINPNMRRPVELIPYTPNEADDPSLKISSMDSLRSSLAALVVASC